MILDWISEIPLQLQHYAFIWSCIGIGYVLITGLKDLLVGLALQWWKEQKDG